MMTTFTAANTFSKLKADQHNTVIVRKGTVYDAVYISLLARITFAESFGHLFRDYQDVIDYCDKTFSVDKISSSLEKENNTFFIAFCDGLPVGYAKFKKYSPSDFIGGEGVSQLQKIYVLKDFQSKKIGQALLDNIFLEMTALQKNTLWLSVYVENRGAIRFYAKNGFVAAGSHTYSIGKEIFEFTVVKKDF
ncbi:GNAT family N-acetyltransferase [Ferruginibacter sp.]